MLSHLDIVHADIKPDNILIDINKETGKINDVSFIDFGSAFYLSKVDFISMSTPEYLAPEILTYLDSRNSGGNLQKMIGSMRQWSFDMWSFGAILLEIVSGFPLWLPLKGRIVHPKGRDIMGTGIFGVAGRNNKKIILR
jgi:dual specificity tyrosine-phosphorylation-regulated kinase 2/3/4